MYKVRLDVGQNMSCLVPRGQEVTSLVLLPWMSAHMSAYLFLFCFHDFFWNIGSIWTYHLGMIAWSQIECRSAVGRGMGHLVQWVPGGKFPCELTRFCLVVQHTVDASWQNPKCGMFLSSKILRVMDVYNPTSNKDPCEQGWEFWPKLFAECSMRCGAH
jgi:hypothetical protein